MALIPIIPIIFAALMAISPIQAQAANNGQKETSKPDALAASELASTGDARRTYELGLEFYRNENWNDASICFEALFESKYGKNWKSRSRLLWSLSQMGSGNDAAALPKLASVAGEFGAIADELRWMLGETYFRLHRYKEALVQYRKVGKIYRKRKDRLGISLSEGSRFFDAQIRELECLLELQRAKSVLARSHKWIKELEGKRGQGHPRLADLFWLRSIAYRLLKKDKREADTLLNAPKLCPNSRFVSRIEGRIDELKAQGLHLPSESTKNLRASIEKLKTIWAFEEILEHVAAWEADRLPSIAKEDELSDVYWILMQKGKAMFALQQYREALEIFVETGKREGLSDNLKAELLYQRARTLGRMNRLEEASKCYQLYVKRYPGSSRADTAKFLAAWVLGNIPGKRVSADRMLEDYIEDGNKARQRQKAMWFRAWFAYRNGDFAKALSLLFAVKDAYPKGPYVQPARYWIGRINEKLGRSAQAKSYYVFLAGDESLSYYRLAAMDRLYRMLPSDEFHPLPPQFCKLLDDNIVHAKVKDEEVNAGYEARYSNWISEVSVLAEQAPYTQESFQRSVTEVENEIYNDVTRGLKYRLRRLNDLAGKWRSSFPDLRQAMVFDRLAMRSQALSALNRFLDRLLTARGKRRADVDGEANEQEVLLGRDRVVLLEEADSRLAYDLMAVFIGWEDIAGAYRTYAKLMNRKERNLLPWSLGRRIRFPVPFSEEIWKASKKHDVPGDLIVSVMRKESRFDPHAISYASAIGLMQVMPHTGERIAFAREERFFERTKLFSPDTAIDYGAWYLGQLLIKFKDQLPLAIASYNGGPHNVALWLERNPGLEWDEFIESIEFAQTRLYVKLVLRNIAIYRYVYTEEFSSWDMGKPIDYDYGDNIDF